MENSLIVGLFSPGERARVSEDFLLKAINTSSNSQATKLSKLLGATVVPTVHDSLGPVTLLRPALSPPGCVPPQVSGLPGRQLRLPARGQSVQGPGAGLGRWHS